MTYSGDLGGGAEPTLLVFLSRAEPLLTYGHIDPLSTYTLTLDATVKPLSTIVNFYKGMVLTAFQETAQPTLIGTAVITAYDPITGIFTLATPIPTFYFNGVAESSFAWITTYSYDNATPLNYNGTLTTTNQYAMKFNFWELQCPIKF